MEELIKQNGDVNETVKYLGRANNQWIAVPATIGSQIKGPCSRIDLLKQHAGIDIQAMYPAGSAPKADDWTLDDVPQGGGSLPQGRRPVRHRPWHARPTNVDSAGAFFHAHGAMLVDAKGNITVKSDPVRQALEFYKKLASFMPPDIPAWDDASNNKWLVSGRGAMIMNPPSAWAVAKRDAPQIAEQLWTHGFPIRSEGPLRAVPAVLLGHLELLARTSRRRRACWSTCRSASSAEKMVAASGGYDLPSFSKLTDFKTWAEEGPPKGTLYHYPNPHNHQVLSIAAAPAPPKIAHQIYTQAVQTKMIVRYMQGEAMEKTLAWAESEVEGFMRT